MSRSDGKTVSRFGLVRVMVSTTGRVDVRMRREGHGIFQHQGIDEQQDITMERLEDYQRVKGFVDGKIISRGMSGGSRSCLSPNPGIGMEKTNIHRGLYSKLNTYLSANVACQQLRTVVQCSLVRERLLPEQPEQS